MAGKKPAAGGDEPVDKPKPLSPGSGITICLPKQDQYAVGYVNQVLAGAPAKVPPLSGAPGDAVSWEAVRKHIEEHGCGCSQIQ